jgi:DNA polymerase elongation subunit (family B)
MNEAFSELCDYINTNENRFYMKREVIADNGIWTGKKRYAMNVYDNEGVRYHEPVLKITGLASIKSSTPSACRSAIEEAIRIMLKGTEEELQDHVQKFREIYDSMSFEDIAVSMAANGISQFKDKTKSVPIQCRAALNYNELLQKHKLDKRYDLIKDGEKIKYAYLKLPNPLFDNVIACLNVLPKEFELDRFIDYETNFEKGFMTAVTDIATARGWSPVYQSKLPF